MSKVIFDTFTVSPGYGKVVSMRQMLDDDTLVLLYSPEMNASEDKLAPFMQNGQVVTLTPTSSVITLMLPGTYKFSPQNGSVSSGMRLSVTDGTGFPVVLTVEAKNAVG